MHYDVHNIDVDNSIDVNAVNSVLSIDAQIPEFHGKLIADKILSKLEGKAGAVILAYHDGIPVGYKIGYALSEPALEFYSWLGAVIPQYRNRGIAGTLLKRQELWAKDHGYNAIRVKSMNQFPAMLQMLIANDYQISGYDDNGSLLNNKICFIKFIGIAPY